MLWCLCYPIISIPVTSIPVLFHYSPLPPLSHFIIDICGTYLKISSFELCVRWRDLISSFPCPPQKKKKKEHRSKLLFIEISKLQNMVCVELHLQLFGKQMKQVCSLSNKLHRPSPPLRFACASISHFLECKPH